MEVLNFLSQYNVFNKPEESFTSKQKISYGPSTTPPTNTQMESVTF